MPVIQSYQSQTLPAVGGGAAMPAPSTARLDPRVAGARQALLAGRFQEAYHHGMAAAQVPARIAPLQAKTMEGLAKVVHQAAETFYHVGQAAGLSESRLKYQQELLAYERELKEKGDYQKAPELIRNKAQELRGKYGLGLAGAYRQNFENLTQTAGLRAEIRLTDWARKQSLDATRANYLEESKLLFSRFQGASAGERNSILTSHDQQVDLLVQVGAISRAMGVELKQDFRRQAAGLEVGEIIEQDPDAALKLLKSPKSYPDLGPGDRQKLIQKARTALRLRKAEEQDAKELAALGELQDRHGNDYGAMIQKAGSAAWLKQHGLDLTAGARLRATINARRLEHQRALERARDERDRGLTAQVVELVQQGKLGQANQVFNQALTLTQHAPEQGYSQQILKGLGSYLSQQGSEARKARSQMARAVVTQSIMSGDKTDWDLKALTDKGVSPEDADDLLKLQASQRKKAEQARRKGLPNQVSEFKQLFRGLFTDKKKFALAWPQAQRRFMRRLQAEGYDVYDPRAGKIVEVMLQEVEIDVPWTPSDYEGPLVDMPEDIKDEDLPGVDSQTVRDVHYYLAYKKADSTLMDKRMVALAAEKLRAHGKPVSISNLEWVMDRYGEKLTRLALKRWW